MSAASEQPAEPPAPDHSGHGRQVRPSRSPGHGGHGGHGGHAASPPGVPGALAAVLLGSAALGTGDALRLVAAGATRYPNQTARLVLGALLTYATLGLVLGVVAAVTSRLAARTSGQRAVGTLFGALLPLAGYLLWSEIRLALLAPLAMLVALLAVRSSSARLARSVRPVLWSAALGCGLAACLALELLHPSRGAWFGWPAVLAGLLLAALALVAAWREDRSRALSSALGCASVLAGVLAWVLVWVAAPRTAPATHAGAAALERPNILLVTIDTLRADRVGAYGRENPRTPNIDALARTGYLFENTSAQSYVTGPSHTTLLCGVLPPEHGALANGMHPFNTVRSLPEWLSNAGFDSAAFISGFTLVERSCGLAGRFDWYDDDLFGWQPLPGAAVRLRLIGDLVRQAREHGRSPERIARPASEVVDASLAWLDRRRSEAPFFLWAHFYDPHVPYDPPREFDPRPEAERVDWYELSTSQRAELVTDESRLARMLELYEAEVAYADAQLGRLLAGLEQRGHGEQLIVVLTADHGESLGEQGTFFDHVALYESELSVPLVVRLPGRPGGRRIAAATRHVDLAPTLLELVAAQAGSTLSGTSLVPLLTAEGSPSGVDGAQLAFGLLEGQFSGYALGGTQSAVRRGHLKLLRFSEHWLDSHRVAAREELYDLAADPGELENLISGEPLPGERRPGERGPGERGPGERAPGELEGLRAALDFWQERLEAGSSTALDLDPDVLEELRRLGYL